jgi:hypothetical protein
MTTNRTPIQRPARTVVSPRALELFAELERARRARKRAVDCTIDALHTELRLKPWQWPCLPRNPYPPGSPTARGWRPGQEQQELWDLLDKARRGAVVRSSRKEDHECRLCWPGHHAHLISRPISGGRESTVC